MELLSENTNNLWPIVKELEIYLKNNPAIHAKILDYLNEAMEKFMVLQPQIFSSIVANEKIMNSFLGKKIDNPTEIIHLVNPYIKNWTDFFEYFRIAFVEIFESINSYIKKNIVNALEERLSEQQKNENREIVMMLKLY